MDMPMTDQDKNLSLIKELKLAKAAAEEASRTGTRNTARVSGPRKPLRLGQALSAQGFGKR